jgi:hypothetical protein
MRTLNCKRVALTIPLYVAGDLLGKREREVAAHLADCEVCRRLAEEFSESRTLLTQACTPPVFGPEFYSGIRGAVLDEIARDRRRSKPALFQRPWIYATAFTVIVIAFLAVLQHFDSARREPSRGVALAPPATGQPNSGQTGPAGAPSRKILAVVNRHRSFRQFEAMRKPDESAQAVRDDRAPREQTAQSSASVAPVASESTTLSGGSSSSQSESESASQVSRIEIQTADPNIRIIWLSPRESQEPDATKHDQDQPETSNRK